MKHVSIVTLNKIGINDFAKERNTLLSKSKTDWVFFVDKDETVPDALRQEINQLINNSLNPIKGYYVKRHNYFLGKYVGTDKIVRIMKKRSGKWMRAVHEVFVLNNSVKVGQLENPLIHNTAENLHGYINKINFYAKIHAKENIKEGKKSNIVKIAIYPFIKFVVTLAKSRNIVFSIMQSFHSFLGWSIMWFEQNKKKNNE
jgi:hypothetical protein